MKIYYNSFAGLFFLFAMGIMLLSSVFINNNEFMVFEWSVELLFALNLNFPLVMDKSSLMFSSVVFFISANVLLFSNSYMVDEKENNRFLLIMLLFIASMNLLIFVPNMIFLLLGWDGLGLVSFLLVIHYTTPQALSSGYITVLTNRVGDALIIVSIPLLYSSMTLTPSSFTNHDFMWLIIPMIVFAAMTKSAQIPFSSWLPAAMAAPTPISALVHSSTLVTAGIYLIYRFYPMLSPSMTLNSILLFLATLTMLMAGHGALVEMDMKKIIALSTLSQLGVMMFSLSLNLPELALFHLLTHATFKALLFIGAGNFILQSSHSQDLRQFGSMYFMAPLSFSCMSIANLALIAFPFMAGYFSKDLIIEMCMFNSINIFLFVVVMAATILTLLYSLRFSYMVFASSTNHLPLVNFTNKDKNVNTALTVLSMYVILSGALTNWNFMFPYVHPTLIGAFKFFLSTCLILALFLLLFISHMKNCKEVYPMTFTRSMWHMNFTNSQFLMKNYLVGANKFYKLADTNWTELLLGRGVLNSITPSYTNYIVSWQQHSALSAFFMLGLVIVLTM